jgi:fucose 4-O-acetylase-like acetyltransferase
MTLIILCAHYFVHSAQLLADCFVNNTSFVHVAAAVCCGNMWLSVTCLLVYSDWIVCEGNAVSVGGSRDVEKLEENAWTYQNMMHAERQICI